MPCPLLILPLGFLVLVKIFHVMGFNEKVNLDVHHKFEYKVKRQSKYVKIPDLHNLNSLMFERVVNT